jgi:hypothetical protein
MRIFAIFSSVRFCVCAICILQSRSFACVFFWFSIYVSAQFFSFFSSQPDDQLYSVAEAKKVLLDYITKSNVTDPKDKSQIILDPLLCDVLFKDKVNKLLCVCAWIAQLSHLTSICVYACFPSNWGVDISLFPFHFCV